MDGSEKKHMTEISLTGRKEKNCQEKIESQGGLAELSSSDVLQNINRLYENACTAENERVKANQAEILCWRNFIIGLDNSIGEIMIKEKRINRARKVYEFTEKIGSDKIKYIKTYNANAIAELSVSQLQTIIDYFSKNPNTELPDDQEGSISDSEEEISEDQTDASEAVSASKGEDQVSIPTAPIPSSHESNSSGNSKGTGPGNSFKAEVSIPSKPPTSSGKKSKVPPKRTQNDQLIPLKKNLPKKMREDAMNSVINRLNVSELEVNFSINREGEHQMDCYTIFGLPSRYFAKTCPICAKTHRYLDGKWWIDRQGNKRYYLKCDNIKEPGIPLDEVLEVYSKNFD